MTCNRGAYAASVGCNGSKGPAIKEEFNCVGKIKKVQYLEPKLAIKILPFVSFGSLKKFPMEVKFFLLLWRNLPQCLVEKGNLNGSRQKRWVWGARWGLVDCAVKSRFKWCVLVVYIYAAWRAFHLLKSVRRKEQSRNGGNQRGREGRPFSSQLRARMKLKKRGKP